MGNAQHFERGWRVSKLRNWTFGYPTAVRVAIDLYLFIRCRFPDRLWSFALCIVREYVRTLPSAGGGG